MFRQSGYIISNGTMNNAAFGYLLPRANRSDGRYTSSSSSINNEPAAKSTYDPDSSPMAQTENEDLHSTALTRTPPADGHVNASSLNANQATMQRADPLPREKRTRKGHKKSRAGCYSCKKGKIKVCNSSIVATRLTLESGTVPRESTRMPQLHTEEYGVYIPNTRKPNGITLIRTLPFESYPISQPAEHTNRLHLNRHAALSPLSYALLSSLTSW